MKSLALSMLAIASIAAMSSCSSENDPVDEVIAGNQEKVEIKLSAGTIGVETKAPIINLEGLANSDKKIGIYAIDGTGWTATPRIANQSSSTNTSGDIIIQVLGMLIFTLIFLMMEQILQHQVKVQLLQYLSQSLVKKT